MTNLTEQEVCIGSLGQQKVYLHWSDVKDICTNAVSEAYEQTKRENAQLKELLKEWIQFEIEENPNDFTVMSERMSGLANKAKRILK